MCKGIYSLLLCWMLCTPVQANGNLSDLIVELENVKRLVEQQQASDEGQHRIRFRYEAVVNRLDALISDIKKHQSLLVTQPRIEVIDG